MGVNCTVTFSNVADFTVLENDDEVDQINITEDMKNYIEKRFDIIFSWEFIYEDIRFKDNVASGDPIDHLKALLWIMNKTKHDLRGTIFFVGDYAGAFANGTAYIRDQKIYVILLNADFPDEGDISVKKQIGISQYIELETKN